MKGSLIIIAFFIAGLCCGLLKIVSNQLHIDLISQYALWVLMFLAGASIGADRNSWKVIRSVNFKIFLVPIGVISGTLLGSAFAATLLPGLSLRETLAVGSGFGYYSLSSLFITDLHSAELGVVALISNILREITTLLATPLLVKYFGKLAGIASGGATAMDTTLPVISRYSGREYAIISVFSGVVLTILVPILVTFILKI
jgi:uncharacterized membrane protein YbjE (DUF340 family)